MEWFDIDIVFLSSTLALEIVMKFAFQWLLSRSPTADGLMKKFLHERKELYNYGLFVCVALVFLGRWEWIGYPTFLALYTFNLLLLCLSGFQDEKHEPVVSHQELPAEYHDDNSINTLINDLIERLWLRYNGLLNEIVNKEIAKGLRNLKSVVKNSSAYIGVDTDLIFEDLSMFCELGQMPPRLCGVSVSTFSNENLLINIQVEHQSTCRLSVKGPRAPNLVMKDFSVINVVPQIFLRIEPMHRRVTFRIGLVSPIDFGWELCGTSFSSDFEKALTNFVRARTIKFLKKYLLPKPLFAAQVRWDCKENFTHLKYKLYTEELSAYLYYPTMVLKAKVIKGIDLFEKPGSLIKDPKVPRSFVVTTVGSTSIASDVCKGFEPTWDLISEFPIETDQGRRLYINVYKEDKTSAGRTTLNISKICSQPSGSRLINISSVSSAKLLLETEVIYLDLHHVGRQNAESGALSVVLGTIKTTAIVKHSVRGDLVFMEGSERKQIGSETSATSKDIHQGQFRKKYFFFSSYCIRVNNLRMRESKLVIDVFLDGNRVGSVSRNILELLNSTELCVQEFRSGDDIFEVKYLPVLSTDK